MKCLLKKIKKSAIVLIAILAIVHMNVAEVSAQTWTYGSVNIPYSVLPSVPTLTVGQGSCGTGEINLSWSTQGGAINYKLVDNNNTSTPIYSGSGSSYKHSSLTPLSSHSYTIQAEAANGLLVSGYSSPVSITAPAACPTADITADNSNGPITIAYGASATLRWSSTNTSSCTGTNFSTANATNNSTGISTGALTASKTYSITCNRTSGSTDPTDSVTVNVNPAPPIVDLKANGNNSLTINSGTVFSLSWTTTNATSCTASSTGNVWSGSKSPTGGPDSLSTTNTRTFTLTCSGPGGGPISDSVTVTVATVINGTCNQNNHYQCSAGTSVSNTTGATSWTWGCNGSGGGTNTASNACSEPYTVSVSATTPYNTTPNANVAFAYTASTIAPSGTTECRLLDYLFNPFSPGTYQASSPINRAAPGAAGQYVYYVQCRNTVYTSVTGTSNQIVVDVVPSINGTCNQNNHYQCSAGTSVSNTTGATSWTWGCNGSGGGTNTASNACSEPYTVSVSATTPYNTTPNANVAFAYTASTIAPSGTTECRLLDYLFNPFSPGTYQASSPINRAAPGANGSYDYYVQCRNTVYTSVTGISNKIVVNTLGATTPGQCSANHYQCSAGTSVSNTTGATSWTWGCNSIDGGTNASCSEPYTVSVSATTPYNTTPNANVAFAYTASTIAPSGTTECRLLDYLFNPFSPGTYQASSPINRAAPGANGSYDYYVQCRNTVYTSVTGISNKIVVNATTAVTIPNTPTGLSATTSGTCGGNINVSWTASSGATTYLLKIDGSVTPIDVGNVTSYTHTVSPGTAHTYSVSASNSAGNSAYSSTVSATASAACASLTIPTLGAPVHNTVLNTSANMGVSSISDGGASLTARGTCWSTGNNFPQPIPPISTPSIFCASDTGTAAAGFTHNRTGLPSSTTIYYRAYATNSQGTGYSSQGNFTTLVSSAYPDLTAALSGPATASYNKPVTFSGSVINGTSTATSSGFNNLFQWSSAAGGTGPISTISVNALGALGGGANSLISSSPFTFPPITIYGTKWGSSGSGDGQFTSPNGVTVSSSGDVYVADTGNNRIQKFNSSGVFSLKWGVVGSGDGQFTSPNGVTVSSSGDVYVADTGNNRIQKFNSSGVFSLKWGAMGSLDGRFSGPTGVAINSSGDVVYVADQYNKRVQKFDSSGNFLLKWGSSGTGNGQFLSPNDVAVDSIGNVYVIDTDNARVQKFDSSGNFLLKWGSYGSLVGQFLGPNGIAVDSSGYVYVSDTGNARVQKFDSSGNIIATWGSSGSSDGQFTSPNGVAVSSSGDVYISDSGNRRVQKFISSTADATYSVRLCADNDANMIGTVNEGPAENNNCSGWLDVLVSNKRKPIFIDF